MTDTRFARNFPLCAVLLLLLLALEGNIARAQSATFGGAVMIDPTEKPLANAEILFTALNRSVRSDSAGNFLLSGLPRGKHALVVKMVGYEFVNTEITLAGGKLAEVDLLRKPTTQKSARIHVRY